MLDIYRIRTRLKEVRKRVTILDKKFKGIEYRKFVGDETLNAAAERNLQVAIQACLDIANHIVSSLGLEKPNKETAEAFYSIAKEGIIPEDFADTMKSMTGYRNVVVHDYLDLDRDRTFEYINNKLSDFGEFAKYIEEFLEKNEKKVI